MSDSKEYLQILNRWFSPKVKYEGWGKAEFIAPEGTIEGPVIIEFDEFGDSTIEMVVEKLETRAALPFGAQQFLSGADYWSSDSGIGMSLGGKTNTCSKLEVTTDEGVFIAENTKRRQRNITYWYSVGFGNSLEATIRFSISNSTFISKSANKTTYWILPLINFIIDFRIYSADVNSHPLYNKSQNPAIIFKFNDCLGFIESIDNFEESKNKLLKGDKQQALTSLMVGNIGANSIHSEDVEQWFPFSFISLLTLASGSEVGASWIEFRDEQGNIVQRYHQRLVIPTFAKGHIAIRQIGIGHLLTNFSTFRNSSDYDLLPLRAIIGNLVKGGYYNLTIEDKLGHVCRGIVALCRYYKVDTLDLLGKLDPVDKQFIEGVIETAQKSIQLKAERLVEVEQSRQLTVLSDKLNKLTTKTVDFGLAACELMKKFNLPDANIIDRYYKANPRQDGLKTWASVISKYRNVTIRESYFNFLEGTQSDRYNVRDVLRITHHLHDILLRIVLKIFGYTYTYQPTVSRYSMDENIDWVKPDTPPYRLGYEDESDNEL